MLSHDAQAFLDHLHGFATDDAARPYCYRADETGEYYWLTEADLERYVAMAAERERAYEQRDYFAPWGEPSLYSMWCNCSGERVSRADAVRLNLIDADDDYGE